jgi:methyl-accepting chemotaxis protein
MHERREAARQGVVLQAEMTTASGGTVACAVRDLSERGARLSFADASFVPDRFRLRILGREWSALAEVRWREGRQVGVEFRSLRCLVSFARDPVRVVA